MTDDVTAGTPSVAKQDAGGAPVAPPAGRSLRVVQRVVFPGADLDVVPLYVETNPDRGAAELHAEQVASARGYSGDKIPPPPSGIGVATAAATGVAALAHHLQQRLFVIDRIPLASVRRQRQKQRPVAARRSHQLHRKLIRHIDHW